jgi:tubulin gamma
LTWSLGYALSIALNHTGSNSGQVINGIQTGPYKNIYNPENFYVGKNGVGAGNNWGDGYQTGELVHEEIMEMIDREADGSDSLEVG